MNLSGCQTVTVLLLLTYSNESRAGREDGGGHHDSPRAGMEGIKTGLNHYKEGVMSGLHGMTKLIGSTIRGTHQIAGGIFGGLLSMVGLGSGKGHRTPVETGALQHYEEQPSNVAIGGAPPVRALMGRETTGDASSGADTESKKSN